jgi:hypothetical protein
VVVVQIDDDTESETIELKIDWHDIPISLCHVDQLHGDSQGYLESSYPTWNGGVKKMLADYFESEPVRCVNVFAEALEINKLKGDERIEALRKDLASRADPASPVVRNRRATCNKTVAYDQHDETEETPGGGTKINTTFTKVDTPTFEARLKVKQIEKDQTAVNTSISRYQRLLDAAEQEGIMPSGSKQPKSATPKVTKVPPKTMGVAAHQKVVDEKDKEIRSLRTMLNLSKKRCNDSTTSSKDGDLELQAAKVRLLSAESNVRDCNSQIFQMKLTITQLEEQRNVHAAEMKAAVAEAKVQTMEKMMMQAQHGAPNSAHLSS